MTEGSVGSQIYDLEAVPDQIWITRIDLIEYMRTWPLGKDVYWAELPVDCDEMEGPFYCTPDSGTRRLVTETGVYMIGWGFLGWQGSEDPPADWTYDFRPHLWKWLCARHNSSTRMVVDVPNNLVADFRSLCESRGVRVVA